MSNSHLNNSTCVTHILPSNEWYISQICTTNPTLKEHLETSSCTLDESKELKAYIRIVSKQTVKRLQLYRLIATGLQCLTNPSSEQTPLQNE